MKATIEVADRKAAEQIRRGLNAPDVRAFVRIVGTLLALPSDRARIRVLRYVQDLIEEANERRHRH